MLYYLNELTSWFDLLGPLKVFEYITFRAMAAALTALLFCFCLGPMTIRLLTRLKLGQPLRTKAEVHKLADLHSGKKGTPTMGGILIILSVVFSCLLWARPSNVLVWLVLFGFVWLGVVGFVDDYIKVTRKKSDGIPGRVKLAAQGILALVVTLVLFNHEATAQTARQLEIPFFKAPLILDMGWLAFPFYALVIMGASNAVNLTDGLDGLATGCTITVALVYAVFSYIIGSTKFAQHLLFAPVEGAAELSIFCSALVGGGLGFLWFNCHPAKMFMGDTGSLAIGGALGVVAICTNQELLLILAGGVFVMEAGSVVLQVASFKMTGKRIFLMSPLHHHFELKGWNESTVTVRFWILSLLFALLALSTLKLR
jgi:phospho-N-acetylmuramoyl-pentapeptide-transferase